MNSLPLYNTTTMADDKTIDASNTMTGNNMQAATSNAATRVFSIYELCESIVLASRVHDSSALARTN